VTADGPLLGQKRILELLNELGRRCADIGFSVDMFVVGGGGIALAYGEDRATRDIDAIFEPKMRVYEIASTMADEFELPRDWLNDGVKGLLPDFEDSGRQFTVESGGIRVVVPSPERVKAQSDGSSSPSYSTNIEIAASLTVLYGDSADTDCRVTGRRT